MKACGEPCVYNWMLFYLETYQQRWGGLLRCLRFCCHFCSTLDKTKGLELTDILLLSLQGRPLLDMEEGFREGRAAIWTFSHLVTTLRLSVSGFGRPSCCFSWPFYPLLSGVQFLMVRCVAVGSKSPLRRCFWWWQEWARRMPLLLMM